MVLHRPVETQRLWSMWKRCTFAVRNIVRAYNAAWDTSNLVVLQPFGTRAEADIALGILESQALRR